MPAVITEIIYAPLKKITFAWTSDGAGNATETTAKSFTGVLERVVQIPDAGGTQPTSLYDIVVNDSDGADILHGLGADLSNAVATNKSNINGLGSVVNSTLSISVSAAGASKGGKTIIYLR